MNKRTDNERLLEEVLAAEADGGFREASLENILRLARRGGDIASSGELLAAQ